MHADKADQIVSVVFGDTDNALMAVDHVFTVMAATYCAAWDRSLGNAPIADIKTAWAYQLEQFTRSKQSKRAIVWALQNLPDKVPSPFDFRNLCRQAPRPANLAIDGPLPKANPEMAAMVVKALSKPMPKVDHKAWAHSIIAQHAAGRKYTPTVLQMARGAAGAV